MMDKLERLEFKEDAIKITPYNVSDFNFPVSKSNRFSKKIFPEVTPCVVVCPACGIKSITTNSNKDFWLMMWSSNDTMFVNAKCKHNFILSAATVFDKNNNKITYPQKPKTLLF